MSALTDLPATQEKEVLIMSTVPSVLTEPLSIMEADTLNSSYRPVHLSLSDLADRVRHAQVRDKVSQSAPGFFFGEATQSPTPGPITNALVKCRTALVLDIEGTQVPADAPARVARLPWASLTYGSPTYRSVSPRWRVIIPSKDPLSPGDTARATWWVIHSLGAEEWVDPVCDQAARRYFAPLIATDNGEVGLLELEGLPCHLAEGSSGRWFSMSDVPEAFEPPAEASANASRPFRGRRQDPRDRDDVYGAFARHYDLDTASERCSEWVGKPLPYEHVKENTWRWVGADGDGCNPDPSRPALVQFAQDAPLYFDHAGSSPHAGQTLWAFDIVASWAFGPQAARDGRPDLDGELARTLPPQERPSTKALLAYIEEHMDQFPEIAADVFPTPAVSQAQAPAPADPEASAPPASAASTRTVDEVRAKLSPLRAPSMTRKLDTPGDRELIAAHDPVMTSLVRDVRTGKVGWLTPPPGRRPTSQDAATARKVGYYPRSSEDLSLVRDYVSSTYANRLVTADVAKLILDRAVSSARPHDDFAEYLDALPAWDGVPRLDRWHAGVVDDPDDRLALRRFVISLVARTRRPGCKVGWIPVLIGAQDTLKTTTLEWLVGDRCYQMQNLDEPHLMEKLVRYPLVIWDEFHLSQSDRDPYVNRAKALITGSSDMWHENYSTSESEAARMWVMAATTNAFDIPSSMEGTRRFMPVRIASDGGPRGADGGPLWRTEALREQIMAEAVAAFEAGEPFTLSDPTGREAQRRALSRVREASSEAEDIARFLSQEWPSGWCAASADARAFYRRQRASTPTLEVQGVPGELTLLPVVTLRVLMQDALCLPSSSWSSRRIQIRVKAALMDLGWVPGRRRIGGTSTAVWLRPAPDPVLEATKLTAEVAASA